MEITDVFGVGAPTVKLLDMVQAACGKWYEPIHQKRISKVKADDLKLIEAAKTDAQIASANAVADLDDRTFLHLKITEGDLSERAQVRIAHVENRRQANIENIVCEAVKALPNKVSDEMPDSDWSARFFSIASEISDAQMQTLWGKLLAGEATKVGTYSLRTLEVLKNLSKGEAEKFAYACRFVWGMNDYIFEIPQLNDGIFISRDSEALAGFGFKFSDRLQLVHAGLVMPGDISIRMSFKSMPVVHYYNGLHVQFDVLDRALLGKSEALGGVDALFSETPVLSGLAAIGFTEAGKQLGGLVADQPHQAYLDLLVERYASHNVKVSCVPR